MGLQNRHPVPDVVCGKVAKEMTNLIGVSSEQQLTLRLENAILQRTGEYIDLKDVCAEHKEHILNDMKRFVIPKCIQKYVENELKFVEPERRLTDPTDDNSLIYYVPILNSLEQLLEHEDILSDVLTDNRSDDGYIRDYQDSDSFKSNEFFQQNPGALRIELYYDDFLLLQMP